ncbi:LuxR C-terminal-related transcriptional regulator [Mycobacterium sp. OTB74]|jgi:DNA-binding CsgD family transcriptional regulator|uniref:helix-turn-helix transcriptional regulator n=1 Tax=Mycobacterium sp. OTB74 TaxID=1853452 RepID=UPI002474D588|nr:LuxR C-terminal-related transcriptional regulator [Mycobacterium sp. OTB74]MDH6245079.1 DNA-binding CsgD family transcriptional regulator [Mycobacterium sp. OTB74]
MHVVEQACALIREAADAIDADLPSPSSECDLDGLASALSRTRSSLHAAMTDPQLREDPRIAALILQSEHTRADVLDCMLAEREARLLGAREAVSRLRESQSTANLIQRVAADAHCMGFDRILFSRINNGTWLPASAYTEADEEFAHTLVSVGLSHACKVNGTLEGEMIRRRTPIVVRDPQTNPRVFTELVTLTATVTYVAAVVSAWGEPIALLHADRKDRSALVDESDRDALSVFAEGLGIALERNLLLDKLEAMRHACNDYARGVNAVADDFTAAAMDRAALADRPVAESGNTCPSPTVGAAAADHLTPREWDVLRGIAAGKTNAQIAVSLFVAEGTVKSHVKNMLRKLGAANRTDAVARYHRMAGGPGGMHTPVAAAVPTPTTVG